MLPPEKQLFLIWWKNIPHLTLTQMQYLLNIDNLDTITDFYKSQRIFPTKAFYSKAEMRSLFSLGFSSLKRIEPDITINGDRHYTQKGILDWILVNQKEIPRVYRLYLAMLYKGIRPWSKIRCNECRKFSSEITYCGKYVPICGICYLKRIQKKWRWNQRALKTYRIKFRKHLIKKGFRATDLSKITELLKNGITLPLVSRRRINKIKDIMAFFSLERSKFLMKSAGYTIITLSEGEDGGDNTVSRGKLRIRKHTRKK